MITHKTVLPLAYTERCLSSKDKTLICIATEMEKKLSHNDDMTDFFLMLLSTKNNEIILKFRNKFQNYCDVTQIMDFSPDNK